MSMRFQGLRLSTLRSTVVTLFPSLNSSAIWNREYQRGDWQTLHSQEELSRYAIIVGHLLRFSSPIALLDVGCGSGRLLQLVSRMGLERYVGVDLSAAALEQARALGTPRAEFVVGSAETFATDARFDAIVFNEVAYYLKGPSEVLSRYAELLRPSGVLIVSMFDCLPASLAWRKLGRRFDSVEHTRVINAKKRAWDVRVLRPKLA